MGNYEHQSDELDAPDSYIDSQRRLDQREISASLVGGRALDAIVRSEGQDVTIIRGWE